MSKYVISEPQFLRTFDKLMQKELNKLTKRTHPSYHGWVFWLDNNDYPIFTYVPEHNVVDIHNELFLLDLVHFLRLWGGGCFDPKVLVILVLP